MSSSADDVTFTSLNPDSGERFQSLRSELGASAFGMNLIVLQPRERGRVHAHRDQEEIYLVLEGELTLIVDGGEHTLARHELARVPPPVRRQIANKGPDRLLLLALGGAGEHIARDGIAWESWEEGGEGHSPQDVPLPEKLPG
ncbi:MAG: cupin domain-containing protein [Thermoleophilaceae bacterium]